MIIAGIAIAFGPRLVPATRSAQPVTPASNAIAAGFQPNESAALFVGVQRFTHPGLRQVRYAADDAVDLAYLFVSDPRIHLVRPDRAVIALSGEPEKPESKEHLKTLRHMGVLIRHADQTDIVGLLRKQAARAGKNGILIVSLATHGFARDGEPFILGASSVVRYPATTVPLARLIDIAARSAGRSLIFIDACRERLSAATRSVALETPTPYLRRMNHTHGQAVFFAAAAGDVAYDGHGNGVFTRAVIEGLQCRAAKPGGTVTPYTLGIYVQDSVLKWIQRNIDRSARPAIQINIDGDARNMPLAQCWPTRRIRITSTKRAIQAFGSEGKLIWEKREGTPLRAHDVGDLFRDHQQDTVALWGNDDVTRLAIYSADGDRLSYCDLPEKLGHVAIGRPTKHYAPRIVVTGKTQVMAFDPKKLGQGNPLWSGTITPRNQAVERLEIIDGDGDGNEDISIKTENGTLLLDFKGKVIAKHTKRGSLQFHLLHSRRKRP
ncbi:MAG TPA: caspase family protein [Thermoanaerobaculia bacterium]|jgi:hypothetical protein